MTKIAALLAMALALAACDTMVNDPYGTSGYPPPSPYPEPYPSEPYPPTYPPGPYPDPYPPAYPSPPGYNDYRASGTEPFWDLTIGARDITFNDRGTGLTIVQPTPTPINGTTGPTYRTPRLEVTVVRASCNNGMSDRTFPDRVQVRADGRLYSGCGGGNDSLAPPVATAPPGPFGPPVSALPAPPLDRTRWAVTAINGRPTPPVGDYSIEFDSGRLSARFGCNNIGATFTQAGNTLDAGAVTATRMACPDIGWEAQGIAVLNQVMQVNALAPNRINLSSSAGTIELRRR